MAIWVGHIFSSRGASFGYQCAAPSGCMPARKIIAVTQMLKSLWHSRAITAKIFFAPS